MAVAYHTHTFNVQEATDEQAAAGLSREVFLVPANLPPLLAEKQGLNDALTSIAGLTTSADQMIYTTGADAYATTALTAYGRSIVGSIDASALLTLLGAGTTGTALFQDETAADARTTLELGSLATLSTISNTNWSGADLAIENGGTGASSIEAARTNLGLGTAATADSTAFATAAQGLLADSAVQPGDGEAVPAGGTTGQVLAKASATDGDTFWTIAGQGDIISTNNGSDFADPLAVPVNIGAMPVATYDPNAVAGDAFDSGNHSGFTAADVAGKTIPATVDSVRTTGQAAPGDGGEAEYHVASPAPAHSLKFSNNGRTFAITKRTIRAAQANAFPSGADMQPALQAAFDYLKEIGGGCLTIDHDEDYIIGSAGNLNGIRIEDPTCEIHIENKAGGVLRAAPGLPVSVLWIGGTTDGTVLDAEFHSHNLKINNQDGEYGIGTATCTGLTLRWLKRGFAYDYECIGEYDATLGVGTVGGDSGIGSVGCDEVYLVNAHIVGQLDTAIYPNWDNSGTVRGFFSVVGGKFERNQNVATPKRGLELFQMDGAFCEGNMAGVVPGDVGASTALPNVQQFIRNTTFKKTQSTVLRNIAGSKSIMDNCLIQDIGYYWNGTGNVGGNARAIKNMGGLPVEIRNTQFEMKDWAPVAEYAFFDERYTQDANDMPSQGFLGRNITLTNWSRFMLGTNDVGTGASEFRDVVFRDLPGAESNLFINVDSSDTIVNYKLFGSKEEKRWQDGITTRHGERVVTVSDDSVVSLGDLSPDGIGTLDVNDRAAGNTMRTKFAIRTTVSPTVSIVSGSSTGVGIQSGVVPTGTTGVDGQATLFVVSGNVYIENRLGGSRVFHVEWRT